MALESAVIDLSSMNGDIIPALSSTYNIGSSRNGELIYGIEIDIGLIPDTAEKDVHFSFDSTYTYWVDNSNSYCSNSAASYPLNYAGNIGEGMSC